ncbi:hypothetical protein EBBID32_15770 [Sphingobium indicum BiD32]|uniref:Uncharacterized protein n=1 Tax=Sphingobium indicum BiD32 TaxID=1301087 RepID=N1MP79_9SPHN|nr:hypothetical protein EBBID32_15770 [Sphingobium indicum BiD32]
MSALLFDYVVEKRAVRTIATLGLDEPDQPGSNGSANGTHS